MSTAQPTVAMDADEQLESPTTAKDADEHRTSPTVAMDADEHRTSITEATRYQLLLGFLCSMSAMLYLLGF